MNNYNNSQNADDMTNSFIMLSDSSNEKQQAQKRQSKSFELKDHASFGQFADKSEIFPS